MECTIRDETIVVGTERGRIRNARGIKRINAVEWAKGKRFIQ
ncbi:hypothetical protein TuanDB_46790 [Bacillus anthracis]|uniref:Uncharacterized protein n=1 Tax=Bacillus anthracis TaxID=1392 RepID=A0A640L169_BACAN|nr:hypothetical protein TuanDB_46790 [Bacillus anthracis]